MKTILAFLFPLGLAAPSAAQGPAFQTPGTPVYPTPSTQPGDSGQADRFASVFNPAFSFIVDAAADYRDLEDGADGFDAELRVLEAAAQAWVDPRAWAYFVGASEDEGLAIEEAAIHFVGLGNSTLRAGRFFIDFGKQMQIHVHELRTLERPLVLRAYLGEEVRGDGLQWDHWIPVGDAAALRWSLGAFADLLPEEAEFPTADESTGEEVRREVGERKRAGDLGFTGRVTAFSDLGSNGTVQLGASVRGIPEYTATFRETNDPGLSGAELEQSDLESWVYGADLTYGWVDDTGLRRWTVGAEALVSTGDTRFDLDPGDPAVEGDATLTVREESVLGYYAFADYAWSRYDSAGLQYSAAELTDAAGSDVAELEAYYTHGFSEFHRLRLVVSSLADESSEDALRVAVQYTAFVGAHGHGISW
jgi:hypothetical protein